MSLSQSASLNVVPLLARLALAAIFIPAGYNKLMKEAEFSGDEAKRLRELSVIASAPSAAPFVPAALVTEPRAQATTPPSGQPANPPSRPSTDETTGAPAGTPANGKPAAKPNTGGGAGGAGGAGGTGDAAGAATGEPVKARALHRVTIMIDKLGWPYQTYLAWAAAITEFVGGICLILGLFTRLWGLGLAITMGVAFYLTSYDKVTSSMVIGMPIDEFNRYASQVALFALSFGLVLTGGGAASVDRRLVGGGTGGDKKSDGE